MAYIPPEIFCKIPLCLHEKIEQYISHPVADLVKAMFNDWRAIFVENTKRDYILSAKWRASELKVYKSIQKKYYRQMKLDMKFGTNDSKIYRDKLAEKRFENIVTKTMLDVKNNYEPYIRANPWAHRSCPQGPIDLPFQPYYHRYGIGYASKKILFKFVQGLNPNARKSWKKEKMLQSIYPNLRFLRFERG